MSAAVLVFVVCALCCVVGHVAILRSVLRKGTAFADGAIPRPRLFVEIVWAILPAIALAFLLTATWARVRDNAPTPDAVLEVAR